MILAIRNRTAVAVLGLFVWAGTALAQGYGYDTPGAAPDNDIRQTVARIGYVGGDVSFSRGDDPDEWQPADPNVPMTLGDRVWTAGGQLELQLHGGNIVRLGQSTDLTALNLTEDTKQLSLSAGVASFSVRRLDDDDVFEVDTPSAAITFERTGEYRIDVRPEGDTRVQVRRGRAIVASGGGQVPLGAGDAMTIEGNDPPRYDMVAMPAPDGWDRWVDERNARYARVKSYQYVSPDIAGVQDLDQYGRWQSIPNYGWCWTPARVAVGWAPYRAGRWIWQDPWGWTWVSAEPWGWAPYHYGRWVVWGPHWYWVPVAPRVAVVTYSPALVAFVGGGPGFSVSVGVSTDYIGWFPLAPRDPLVPWWGRPSTTVVNVTNVTYVNRTYVTVVNQNTFVSSRVVTNNYVRDRSIVDRIERAPVVRGAIPIVPTQESIRVTGRPAAAPRPPAAVAARPVVTRMAPPPAPPRFDNKVAVIRENRGRPVTTAEAQQIVTREGGARAQPARNVRPAASDAGRVTLAPKSNDARAPKPEPVAPVRGRPLATKEQPVAPVTESSPQRGRPAAAPAQEPPASRPAERPASNTGRPASAPAQEPASPRPAPDRAPRDAETRPTPRPPQSVDRGAAARPTARPAQDSDRGRDTRPAPPPQQDRARDNAHSNPHASQPPASQRPTPREQSAEPQRGQTRSTVPREAEPPADRVAPQSSQRDPRSQPQTSSPERGRPQPTKPAPTKPPKKDDDKKKND